MLAKPYLPQHALMQLALRTKVQELQFMSLNLIMLQPHYVLYI